MDITISLLGPLLIIIFIWVLSSMGIIKKQETLDEKIGKDKKYAKRFWDRQPPGMREVIEGNIRKGVAESGRIGCFVSPRGPDEKDREKLSAYRLLAEKMGYEVGSYSFNKRDYIASAPIKKKK